MPVASVSARRRLSTVLRRFKFVELESAVLPTFPEVSWSRIRSKLIKHHESFTVSNVVRLIEEATIGIQEKILKERLSFLELIDISRHYNRKVWYGYSLIGSDKSMHFANREIQMKLTEQFALMSLEMDVKVVTHNGITYVSVKEKERRRQKQRVMAIYFALFLGQKCFFCSRKNVPKDFLMAITNCTGYRDSKSLKLMGKDLRSLVKLLWMKKQGVPSAHDILTSPEYQQRKPLIRKCGMDFTQHKERKRYTERCFGEAPPTLELLVVNGPNQPWADDIVASELPGEKIYTGWEFRSRDVATFLANLTERRVVVTPLPYYMSRLMTMGKNELTLKANRS